MPVAVGGDRFAPHILHREVRSPLRGCARVEDRRDTRMIHQRQCLTLGLKSRNDLRGVHPSLDELYGDLSPNRLHLLGQPHFSHAALAQALQEAVGSEDETRRDRVRSRPRAVSILRLCRNDPLLVH